MRWFRLEAVCKAGAIRQKLPIFELSLQPSQEESYRRADFPHAPNALSYRDILGKHRVSRDQQERLERDRCSLGYIGNEVSAAPLMLSLPPWTTYAI